MERERHLSKGNIFFMILAVLMLSMVAPACLSGSVQAEAATKNGFVESKDGNTYYYNSNGKKVTGWKKISGDWYYFHKSDGSMAVKEFITTSKKGRTFYQGVDGKRVKGWKSIKGSKYYFNPKNKGEMEKGFLRLDGKKYYFGGNTGKLYRDKVFSLSSTGKTYWAAKSGALQKGWYVTSSNNKYYFTINGAKRNGFYKIGKYYYYMNSKGVCAKGWKTVDGNKYYFRKKTNKKGRPMCSMRRNQTATLGGVTYVFDSNGIATKQSESSTATNGVVKAAGSEKTIKNFLRNALQPIGSTLYIWGGGHDDADATRKGLNPQWKTFYNSQSSSYDYNNHRFEYGNGLDCSGYVGWCIYQIMESKSGGTFYTTVSGDVPSTNAARGFGTQYTQSQLSSSNYKFVAGDLAGDSSHTWIVLGQCADKSLVVLHSTPPCVQIGGTPTPSGSYSSKAISLAQKYMKNYYGSTVKKFSLGSSTGNYAKRGNIMRWNTKTLSDPDGYRNKRAAGILKDLFTGS